jgi:uncharacterized protein YbcI
VPDERYIALPDGRYVHVPSDATPQQLSALRERLSGMRGKSGPSGLETFGREAALGAFQGLGISETQNPVKDTFKALGSTPDLKDPGTYLGPAYGIGKGLAKSGAELFEGLGADAQHPEKFGPVDLAKLGHGLGSLSTQLLSLKGGKKAAETSVGESEVLNAPKGVIKQLAGTSERDIAKASGAVEKKNVASQEKFAKVETARKALEQQADSSAKALTDNINKTIETAKTAFDAEYGDFDAKVLGKTAQNPKGTLQAELSPLAQSVKDAQANLITGSEESIKQFKSILGRLSKDYLDVGEGQLGIVPGQKIPAADLRGYVTEMESKLYDGKLEPDVKQAVKSVVNAGKAELEGTIKRQFGPQVVAAFKDLNSRYSDYLTDWRDSSSVNPLPKVRRILLEGVVTKNQLPVYEKISSILGKNSKVAAQLLAKAKKFGADPSLLDNFVKSKEKLDALPSSKEPAPKTFDRREFVEKKVGQLGHTAQRYSSVIPAFQLLHDIVSRKMPGIELMYGPAVGVGINRLLTNPKVIDWLAKEKP